MDEYIKREDAIKHLRGACIAKYPLSFSNGISAAANELLQMPTADVVPKSEVEKLEQDVTRLGQEKDALIKNYAECMKGLAREILEDIAREVASKIPMKFTPIFNRNLDYDAGRTDGKSSAFYEVLALVAKIEKKHTERCPDCKHFVGCECFDGKTCDEYEVSMTDHKFTDEEVIKALELCNEGEDDACALCPYAHTPNCYNESGKDALALINRQKAEIEIKNTDINDYSIAKKFDAEYFNAEIKMLKKTIAELRMENHILTTEYADRVRTEAIKEFAERLTNTIMGKLDASDNAPDGDFYFITDVYEDIDNLVKEMTEEKTNAK